jgi:hypothetical protein
MNYKKIISIACILFIIVYVLYARAAVAPYAKQDHNKYYPLTPEPKKE